MRVFTLILTLGFLLKEAQAWGFRNGIFHNSIWLGKYLYFCCRSQKNVALLIVVDCSLLIVMKAKTQMRIAYNLMTLDQLYQYEIG